MQTARGSCIKEFVNRAWREFRPPRGRVLRLPLATSTWRVGGHGQWAVLYVRRLEEDELLLCFVVYGKRGW